MMKEKADVPTTYKMRVCDALSELHSGACVKNFTTYGQDHIDVFAWQYGVTILYVVVDNYESFSLKREELEIKKSWLAGERKYIVCPSLLVRSVDLPSGYGLIYADLDGDNVRLSTITRGTFLPHNLKKEKDLLLAALTTEY